MNQNNYQIEWMRTLWEHTYRATIHSNENEYLATIRVLLGIPIPADEIPSDAPKVEPYITVLIEDTTINASQIVDLEEVLAKEILQKIRTEDFTPTQCIFFYPSPAEALLKQ